ncbi:MULTISPECIES: hypothetical protein [Pantoea]|jgi:hypothetical protein|uniref:hypothetical protein n=1 Tax=Pantoea TaxID=53335 RepID=UPI001F21C347|nr:MULTISPECIES: hypothetical protein [Pantoea]UIL53740.1 hypothetical protein LZU96_07335 [Pantoea agglomerans]
MYYGEEIIDFLQTNRIVALKLDRALTGLNNVVSAQRVLIGKGAKRALYYTLLNDYFH